MFALLVASQEAAKEAEIITGYPDQWGIPKLEDSQEWGRIEREARKEQKEEKKRKEEEEKKRQERENAKTEQKQKMEIDKEQGGEKKNDIEKGMGDVAEVEIDLGILGK